MHPYSCGINARNKDTDHILFFIELIINEVTLSIKKTKHAA